MAGVALGRCWRCAQVYMVMTESCRSEWFSLVMYGLVLALGLLVFLSMLQRICLMLGVVSCNKGVICLVFFFWCTCSPCRLGVSSFGTWFGTFACWQRSCLGVWYMSLF